MIPRIKIVEVSDPRRTNDGFRSQHPPLTQQQEDYIVNRKLESVAEHYSGMLAWQVILFLIHFVSYFKLIEYHFISWNNRENNMKFNYKN